YRSAAGPGRARSFGTFHQLTESPLQVRERGRKNGPAGVEYDVEIAERGAALAEDVAEAAFDAGGLDGPTDGFGHGNAQARACSGVRRGARQEESGEQRVGKAGAVVIDSSKLGRAQHARGLRKSRRRRAARVRLRQRAQLFRR